MVYKLTYFPIRGLAEPMRLLLADNNIPFDDDQINRDDWPKLKAQMTFGQIPLLHDGDEQIFQSGAILRHLGRKHNLVGSNESETTFIDMVHEGIRDVHSKYTSVIYGDYEGGKENLIHKTLPEQYAILEKLLKTYNNGEKFVAGEKVSYVDYALFEELDIGLILEGSILDKFPLLKAYHQRFNGRPGLAEYLKKRATANIPVNGNGKQ